MMDSLEIFASCDLELCLYSKLNDYTEVYESLNSRSSFAQPFLKFCMFCAYTGSRYQVSV